MISVIKFTNGVEIVGDVVDISTDLISVKDPLQINYRQHVNNAVPSVHLHRFSPFSMQDVHRFRHFHVLSYNKPLPGLEKYYNAVLKSIQSHVDMHVDKELEQAALFMGDNNEEEEIERAMMEKKMYKPNLN